jgi:hypothetical protein
MSQKEEKTIEEITKEIDIIFPVIESIKSIDLPDYNDPCAGCSNNPKNNPHASGICGCTLPYMTRTTY